MSMVELQSEMVRFFNTGKTDQGPIIQRLEKFYFDYGAKTIQKWRNTVNKKNSLLHEFVEREMADVIRYLLSEKQFDINVKRESDNLTPLQLAVENRSSSISNILKEFGAEDIQTVDVRGWSSNEERRKESNIVWMDLEMTSIEDPEILECAVIITDKDLVELEKANWVIHFDRSVLKKLGDWHQKTFADISEEGNGLFADVIKSKLTKDEVEEKLLELLKRHCPPNTCPLAGNSIQTDQMVLKKCMPKAHDYLHYRIIDVTSFQLILRRWVPEVEGRIKKQMARASNGQETGLHRAMYDIERSIAYMKQLRFIFNKLTGMNEHQHEESNPHHHRPSNPPHRGASNNSPRGASNNYPRGASNNYPRGPSNHSPRGPSNYPSRGGNYRRSHSESGHDDRSSVIQSDDEENVDLPMVSSDARKMDLYADEQRLIERVELERTFSVKRLKLSGDYLGVYNQNPHLREVFMNIRHIDRYEKDFTKENRRLMYTAQPSTNDALFTKKYSTTEHWGQRKLLLTEIEFLTKHSRDEKYTVVYAGAAPGSHMTLLGSLFPDLEFILIDDKDFSIKASKNVEIRAEKFSQGTARYYGDAARKIIFICNVRTNRAQADGQYDGKEDMDNQLNWYRLMKPRAALLNFRLPRQRGKTSYLEGHQIIEPWASKRPSECRLVVKKDAKTIDYDNQDFEDNLLRFQNITRVMYYEHDMDDVGFEGLDHCYDCRAEIFILEEYMSKIQNIKIKNDLKNAIARLSKEISSKIEDPKRPRFLNAPRTLAVIPKRSAVISTNV